MKDHSGTASSARHICQPPCHYWMEPAASPCYAGHSLIIRASSTNMRVMPGRIFLKRRFCDVCSSFFCSAVLHGISCLQRSREECKATSDIWDIWLFLHTIAFQVDTILFTIEEPFSIPTFGASDRDSETHDGPEVRDKSGFKTSRERNSVCVAVNARKKQTSDGLTVLRTSCEFLHGQTRDPK